MPVNTSINFPKAAMPTHTSSTPSHLSTAHLLHGFSDLSRLRSHGSLVIERGQGVRVFDRQGRDYIEAASGMWCAMLGFGGEETIVEAAVKQLRELPYYHTLTGRSVGPAIELAGRLAELAPIDNASVYLALSGSEANDFLVKFLRYANNASGQGRRKKIISRLNGYHGATLAAASLTGIAKNQRSFDLPLPGFLKVSDPHYYRRADAGETPDQFTGRLADELEVLIRNEGAETIMGFLAEPVTGGGGVVIPPDGYYEKIQAVLRRYRIPFLADEVITGFGRTGNMFGCETMGIAPAAMTLGKGLTAGYLPLAAIVMSAELYADIERGSDLNDGFFGHGTTYSGHPVCCAVALRVLQLIEERALLAHVDRVAVPFREGLLRLRQRPFVGDVRCVGLIGAIELMADPASRRPFPQPGLVAARVKAVMESHGVIARVTAAGDTIALCPPLVITEPEIAEMFDRLGKALETATDWIAHQA